MLSDEVNNKKVLKREGKKKKANLIESLKPKFIFRFVTREILDSDSIKKFNSQPI